MNQTPNLSVMIPCLNESARLPLLLADLRRSELSLEILLADGGSSDATAQIAGLVGAHLIGVHPAGRGRQLRAAAARARGDWLLFLHAASRLPQQWSAWLTTLLQGSSADASACYFDLRISPSTPARRLLERAVGYTLGKVIRRQILHDLVIDMKKSVASIRDDRQRVERDRLLQTLRDCGGNISQTAEILNTSRSAIYRLIAKHDIPLNRGR